MLLYCGGGYEDVVNIAKNDAVIFLLDIIQHHVDQTMEDGCSIAEPEGNADPLVKSLLGGECRFVSANLPGEDTG